MFNCLATDLKYCLCHNQQCDEAIRFSIFTKKPTTQPNKKPQKLQTSSRYGRSEERNLKDRHLPRTKTVSHRIKIIIQDSPESKTKCFPTINTPIGENKDIVLEEYFPALISFYMLPVLSCRMCISFTHLNVLDLTSTCNYL